MSETFTDTHLWSTDTVRKLVTILLPHHGEKFDRWYAHEINKAYQLGHDSCKAFVNERDSYEKFRSEYMAPGPKVTEHEEVLPEDIG